MNLKQFMRLKEAAEAAARDAAVAEGRRDQVLAELRKEFGIRSLDDAERLLVKERKAAEQLEAEADRLLADYEEKYGGRLKEVT